MYSCRRASPDARPHGGLDYAVEVLLKGAMWRAEKEECVVWNALHTVACLG